MNSKTPAPSTGSSASPPKGAGPEPAAGVHAVEPSNPAAWDAASLLWVDAVNRRWRWARWILRSAVFISVLVAPLLAWIAGVSSVLMFLGLGLFTAPLEQGPEILILVITTYVLFFVLSFLILAPICTPLAVRWKNPPRIVVFRRFNEGGLNVALKRMLQANVVRYGHVFTLADKRFFVSWLVRIPVLLGQLAFFHFRERGIHSARRLERLRSVLERRAVLNMNWLMSWRKVFAIRCADALWQRAVQLLLENADLILIDVSRPREALRWELRECARRKLLDRVVLVALDPMRDPRNFDWFASVLPEEAAALPKFTYLQRGELRDEDRFARIVAQALAPERRSVDESKGTLGRLVLLNICAICAGFAVGFLLMLPYVASSWTANYSPLFAQVREAYLVKGDETAKRRLQTDFREQTRAWVLANTDAHGSRVKELLAAVTDARDVSVLESLVSKSAPLAQGAVEALLRIQPQALGERAAHWIVSTNESVRDRGLEVLRNRPSDLLFESLLATLPGAAGFPGNREVDAFLVARINRQHIDALVRALGAPNVSFRVLAARLLARFGDDRGVPGLIACLTFRYPGVWFIPGDSVYDCKPLLDALFASGARVRVSDVAGFLGTEDVRAAYALRFALRANEAEALNALEAVTVSRPLVDALLPALEAKQAGPAHAWALAHRNWFAPALQSEDLKYCLAAATLLARAGDLEVAPVLVKLAQIEKSAPTWRRNGNTFERAGNPDPYLSASLEALNSLAERVQVPYDPVPLIALAKITRRKQVRELLLEMAKREGTPNSATRAVR